MNSGPLPPHERTWRHPSEVAAAQRAELHATPPSRDAQRLALGAGACVVLLVIVAMFATFSTQKTDAPLTKAQVSVPILAAQISVPSAGSLPGEPVSVTHVGAALRPSPSAVPCLATPVSSGQLALVTTACLREAASQNDTTTGDADRSDDQVEILVTLPDQSEQLASRRLDIDTTTGRDGLSVVSLSRPVEPMSVAKSGLSAADSLALVGSRHLEMSLSELIEISLPDGTPIVNQDGELVAISTDSPTRGTVLISIDLESLNQVLTQVANGPQEPTASPVPTTSGSTLTYSRVASDTTGD